MAEKSVHLPHDLIIEILLRLPVKTVLCCKCVSKSWFSIISNPDFATSHFQLAASPTNKLVRLGKYSETLLSIDFNASLNNDSSYASPSHDFLPPESPLQIGGSCRGFILIPSRDFYLWNPSRGVHKKIPASPINLTVWNFDLSTFLYGLAYDHSTDDYLIVLGSCCLSFDHHVSCPIYFEIFSLRANKWKHIEFDSQLIIYDGCGYNAGLLLNGSIHWMVCNYKFSTKVYFDVIIAFNLKERRMSEIALPYCFNYKDYPIPSNHDLLVLGGLISASIVDMHTVKIWVMKEYAVYSSWTKILEFFVDPALHYSLSMVCFTNCGDIIGRDDEGGLMKFNDKGHLLEHYSSPKGINSRRFQMAVYTESLFSFPVRIEQV